MMSYMIIDIIYIIFDTPHFIHPANIEYNSLAFTDIKRFVAIFVSFLSLELDYVIFEQQI